MCLTIFIQPLQQGDPKRSSSSTRIYYCLEEHILETERAHKQ